jgi:hypothetical protein
MASIEADSKSHSEVLGSLSKHPSLANRHMPSITSISTTRNDWGRKVHEQAMKRTIIVAWMHENYQMIAFVIIDCSYLRFSHPFRPRAESATFFCSPQCESCPRERNKIGDSVLCCKYFTKIQTHRADNKQSIILSLRSFVFL